jgi:heat shock protein HslJ
MPSRLLAALLVVMVAAAACDEAAPADPNRPGVPATIAGTSWRVVSVGGRAPVAGGVPTVAFEVARVIGSGGCNTFGGSYRYDADSGQITFENLGMTAMGCFDGRRNEFETAFSEALVQVVLVSIDARGLLTLRGPGGAIVLEPDPQRAVEG